MQSTLFDQAEEKPDVTLVYHASAIFCVLPLHFASFAVLLADRLHLPKDVRDSVLCHGDTGDGHVRVAVLAALVAKIQDLLSRLAVLGWVSCGWCGQMNGRGLQRFI